ncbi:MAG: ATP-dependent RecD-like DNA helicase [Candidatus Desulfaltia sp.]|nr:ATP-dependent RecD-like DNA helicase [Candidatus Desulfaltia sp.]
MLTDLQGQIEKITYSDKESGFTIAKVKVEGQPEPVTVVGNLTSPVPGIILKMKGEWADHPKYGRQFRVIDYKTVVPATVCGIKNYLGSGLIKGLGPVMAGRIVKKFGIKTLDIIENEIEKLADVDGIGEKRIAMIKTSWDEHKDIRDVMLFLQTYGVSTGYGVKIFKQYGNRSIEIVQENPYCLATDIFGIGFTIADSIAEKLGFLKDSELRIKAGILYVLNHLADKGHVFYPYELLVIECVNILQVNRKTVSDAIDTVADEGKIIIEDIDDSIEEFKAYNKAVYLSKFHFCETRIAFLLKRLVCSPKSIRNIKADQALKWVQKQLDIIPAKNQEAAIRASLQNKAVVITGGPGTGKTTIINAVIKIFAGLKTKIMLAAPTGRAAKQMSETTGHNAATIHRMLKFSVQKGGFQKNEKNPLNCDLLIVDEASMIDTILMHHLLKAIPTGATFILVGDVNQLPSVGPGNVLSDIIKSGIMPVIELNEIFRQARESRIIINAHRINRGIVPDIRAQDSSASMKDFYFIQQEDPEKVLEIIVELVKERIPRRFGFNPIEDIQVLTPMHKGVIGAENLNAKLQTALNPGKDTVISGNRNFKVNDKVMQIKNNYEKDVFNGDIGKIISISTIDREVIISFDGRKVTYSFTDLDEIILAYAVSIHKSQGSEYPAVVIPILTQHYILLQRNLIYTAVTRGINLVVMVGTGKALAIGVTNDKTQKRFTYLRYRLL